MYPQTPIGYSAPLVFSHGGSNPGDGLDEYYASMQPQWTALDTVCCIQIYWIATC